MVNYKGLFNKIIEARAILDNVITHTPILPFENSVYFKAENLQKTGSFKFRGAYYAIAKIKPKFRSRGVIAYSTGNHAQAIAYASSILNVRAVVVMSPECSPIKIAKTKKYGAEVVFAENNLSALKIKAEEMATSEGYILIPPFDDANVIAAQGTIAIEILATIPNCKTFVVPVGGGGLISGIVAYVKSINPSIRVVGVEPKGAADAYRSLMDNKLTSLERASTICDGLSADQLGKINFEIMRKYVDEIVVVDDELTIDVMKQLLLDYKILVEPSGAIALAAIEANPRLRQTNAHPVVAILSGGNIDSKQLSAILS